MEEQTGLYQKSQGELSRLKDEHGKTSKVLEDLKRALNGGGLADDPPVDPIDRQIAHYQGLIDEYLTAAVEAERKGVPIPLTVKGTVESAQAIITQLELNKKLTKQIAALEKNVQRANDPHVAIDQQAFASMDSLLINALDTVYGASDEMMGVKDAQFKSVAGMVGGEIQRLKKEEPELWDRIRRNPTDQKKLVNHFVKQSIPPRARQLMEDETIRNTPITLQDLHQAWQESKDIKDPNARAEIQQKLRLQILEETMRKGGRGRGGINQLYGH